MVSFDGLRKYDLGKGEFASCKCRAEKCDGQSGGFDVMSKEAPQLIR